MQSSNNEFTTGTWANRKHFAFSENRVLSFQACEVFNRPPLPVLWLGGWASKSHPSRKKPVKKKRSASAKRPKSFHVPFEEFPVADLGDLLSFLETVKPEAWTVVVSDSEEAQHVDCMQALAFVNIHPPEEDSSPETMGVIYQYCASCKTAVRVL